MWCHWTPRNQAAHVAPKLGDRQGLGASASHTALLCGLSLQATCSLPGPVTILSPNPCCYPQVVAVYNLTLQVADMSGDGLTATASAIITLKDVNDNAPGFSRDEVPPLLHPTTPCSTALPSQAQWGPGLHGGHEAGCFGSGVLHKWCRDLTGGNRGGAREQQTIRRSQERGRRRSSPGSLCASSKLNPQRELIGSLGG